MNYDYIYVYPEFQLRNDFGEKSQTRSPNAMYSNKVQFERAHLV